MNNLLAALMFFTRLPFWRICTVPSECFRHVVSYWSLCGWLTGGVMALSFWVFSIWFPLPVAVLLALCARLFLTGALHEDGLADFFDGFGGGRDREGILRIMKDSHIGSYGVLGLILYYLLSFLVIGILTCACHSLGAVCGRPFLQVCMQLHAPVSSVRPKRRRKQGQGGLYPHEPFGVDSQYCRRIVAFTAFASFLLGDAMLSMCTFHWIGLAAQATFRRIHRRLLWCTFPFV